MNEREKYKQSETRVIKRSKINFAPYNPKRHSKEQVNAIKKNIKNVAFLGGIVWNETTSNLIDGHKRIMALDIIHGYDGSEAKNYDVKVEVIELDEKTEKEQNIFQTQSRTDFDVELMQILIPEIDYQKAGLGLDDLNYFSVDISAFQNEETDEINSDFDALEFQNNQEHERIKEEKKRAVIEVKKATKDKMQEQVQGDNFVILSFSSYENKVYFMELLNKNINERYIKGEEILELIQ